MLVCYFPSDCYCEAAIQSQMNNENKIIIITLIVIFVIISIVIIIVIIVIVILIFYHHHHHHNENDGNETIKIIMKILIASKVRPVIQEYIDRMHVLLNSYFCLFLAAIRSW